MIITGKFAVSANLPKNAFPNMYLPLLSRHPVDTVTVLYNEVIWSVTRYHLIVKYTHSVDWTTCSQYQLVQRQLIGSSFDFVSGTAGGTAVTIVYDPG